MQNPASVGRILLSLAVVVLCAATNAQSQTQPTGLIFASATTLAGMPAADVPFSGANLPPSIDLSVNLPKPGNQGKEQSCVAWAVAYAFKSYQERQKHQWSLTLPTGEIDPDHVFSPAFVYNQINHGIDAGSTFQDALNVVSAQGVAPLTYMPYVPGSIHDQPSAPAKSAAASFRIDQYRKVNVFDANEVKARLNT